MLCAIFQQRLHALITSVILIITGLDQRFIDRQLLVQHGRTEALGTFDGGRFRLVAADNGNIAVPLLIQVLDSHLAGTDVIQQDQIADIAQIRIVVEEQDRDLSTLIQIQPRRFM